MMCVVSLKHHPFRKNIMIQEKTRQQDEGERERERSSSHLIECFRDSACILSVRPSLTFQLLTMPFFEVSLLFYYRREIIITSCGVEGRSTLDQTTRRGNSAKGVAELKIPTQCCHSPILLHEMQVPKEIHTTVFMIIRLMMLSGNESDERTSYSDSSFFHYLIVVKGLKG